MRDAKIWKESKDGFKQNFLKSSQSKDFNINDVKNMLIKKQNRRVKCYEFSLTEEERREIRNRKTNLSPMRKKFDGIIKRAEIRRIRKRIGEPWDRCDDRPRVKRWV